MNTPTPPKVQAPPPPEQDSLPDTQAHIERVQTLIQTAISNLASRAVKHDASKLVEPEKSAFDRLKALSLSGMAYGSEEYRACLRKEKPAIQHHYKANSHHPEFYENGIDGMSLLDVLEMLLDWKAATERMKDGGNIVKSLEINRERFKISPQLESILANTINEIGWSKERPSPAPASEGRSEELRRNALVAYRSRIAELRRLLTETWKNTNLRHHPELTGLCEEVERAIDGIDRDEEGRPL